MDEQFERGSRRTVSGVVDVVEIERDARRLRALYLADLARRVRSRIAGALARRPSPRLPGDARPSLG